MVAPVPARRLGSNNPAQRAIWSPPVKDKLILLAVVIAGVFAANFLNGFLAKRSAAAAATPPKAG